MVCSNCKNTNNILVCSNCSNYICNKETCQISFPHHNDEIYVICQNCISEISAKLVPLVKTMNHRHIPFHTMNHHHIPFHYLPYNHPNQNVLAYYPNIAL